MQSGLPCIALGPFVRALAQKSYEDFGIIKDQLQNDIPRANRDKLLAFLPMARHKLIRFLVLIRYLKQNHSRIKALEKIHETIIKSEHQYLTACRNFDSLYTEMVTTCEPAWDMESALHVLTLGSYRNLPQIIDKSITFDSSEKRRLSPTFVSSTIKKLNNALRVRLLSDRIPPELNLLNIKKGMVYMIARNQFEIAISLRMRPKLFSDDVHEKERVRWSLFELKLLLKASANTSTEDPKCIVNDMERNALLLAVNNKMKLSKYPLQTMYNELNTFCGKLQFAVFNQQIHCIRYKYNDSNIRIEREAGKFITIRLWKNAADLPQDSYNIADMHLTIQNNKKTYDDDDREDEIQQQWQLNSKKSKSLLGSSYLNTNTNTQAFNMDGLDEFERKENEIKSQFGISLSILYEEQGLNIKYHPRLPSFVADDDDTDGDDYKHLLCVNPNHLNLPQLVEDFMILHSNYRLLYVLNKLMEVDKECKIAPRVKVMNTKHILYSNSTLKQKHKLKIMKNLDAKCIEICVFDDKYVEISVNRNNGRIVFEKAYHEFVSCAPLIFEKHFKIYNDQINHDLSKVSSIIRNLFVDCLLEQLMDTVQNELNLDVISYSPCNKPSKYFVYPSLLVKSKRKKNVRIKEEENDHDAYHSHMMQTYTEILNSWNENNSIFIKIPGFGNHCYLVIFYRSQSNAETYCVVNDTFGNVVYIHNIILEDEKPQYDGDKSMIRIPSHLITKWIAYCIQILPQHLIRIMISLHCSHVAIQQLKWTTTTEHKTIQFDLMLPRAATTANWMHIMPRTFDFEISLQRCDKESSFLWRCVVKQDTIFSKTSLLAHINEIFTVEKNALVFEYAAQLNISQLTRICDYCSKLLVAYNILKGFLDHKQSIKQNSAFYRRNFYRLKRIDLVSPKTRIEVEFGAKCVMNIDIAWNDVDHVEYYTDTRFNPYLRNTDYALHITFSNIMERIPNVRQLIGYYFSYRHKYHKKLHTLLRTQYTLDDKDEHFDYHDAMVQFKGLIAATQSNNSIGKPQSFLFVHYESLSLMMLLQKLYWSVKTLTYVNPFIACINKMHRWFYPRLPPFVQTEVKRHDTLRLICSFYGSSSPMDNIVALRILHENKVCVHQIDSHNGWQLMVNEIEFTSLSHQLLKHIQNDVLLPHKQRLFCKLFERNKSCQITTTQMNNDFIQMPLQRLMFCSLTPDPQMHQVLTLLEYRKDDAEDMSKLGLKQASEGVITLYAFEGVIDKHLCDTCEGGDVEHACGRTIQFINDVMKAYFYLYCAAYPLHHELKVQSFLSVLFSSFVNFSKQNAAARQNYPNTAQQVPPIARALLSIEELFALYYDEMVQLSVFGGKIDQIVGRNYFKNTNLARVCPWDITSENVFWYNLHHVTDNDIIYHPNALCVQIHLAAICAVPAPHSLLHHYSSSHLNEKIPSPSATVALSQTSSPSVSPSPPKRKRRPRTRGTRRRRSRVSRERHDAAENEDDQIWMFEKYKLQHDLLLNVAIDFNDGKIFFYQNYQRRNNNKYRKISITFLPELNQLVDDINVQIKQRAVAGTKIVSFCRQFVSRLSTIKKTNLQAFDKIHKQLQKLNN
eukprot:138614_1